ncbi:hypothetical protein Nepgr_016533 [Nepenthes gracilis]|uniref:Uncharacterized protein n=1 Tax=Nepenthes gracilis TaxID=150966 RepID=A0AAD3SPD7_NEPGR|nr:hypothetical protein Nepgr_016533 [Nepenthes gracilis]
MTGPPPPHSLPPKRVVPCFMLLVERSYVFEVPIQCSLGSLRWAPRAPQCIIDNKAKAAPGWRSPLDFMLEEAVYALGEEPLSACGLGSF